MSNGFTWSHGVVQAGTTVTVTVSASPCRPVKVTFTVDGQQVGVAEITDVPGTAQFAVPADAQGKGYVFKVSCNGQGATSNGTVS